MPDTAVCFGGHPDRGKEPADSGGTMGLPTENFKKMSPKCDASCDSELLAYFNGVRRPNTQRRRLLEWTGLAAVVVVRTDCRVVALAGINVAMEGYIEIALHSTVFWVVLHIGAFRMEEEYIRESRTQERKNYRVAYAFNR